MRPMPLSPLPNFSQKAPYWGWECPQRWGSWKATYRKKGLRRAGHQCQGLGCAPGSPLLQAGAPSALPAPVTESPASLTASVSPGPSSSDQVHWSVWNLLPHPLHWRILSRKDSGGASRAHRPGSGLRPPHLLSPVRRNSRTSSRILVMLRPTCSTESVSSVCAKSKGNTASGPTCFFPMMPGDREASQCPLRPSPPRPCHGLDAGCPAPGTSPSGHRLRWLRARLSLQRGRTPHLCARRPG